MKSGKNRKVGVLALQGAFIEHERLLNQLGAEYIEIRQKSDLSKDFQGLILPGGESTVQGKLLHQLDLYQTLKQRIQDGMPVLATCAGLILLAEEIENDTRKHFATLPITVRRNAYGRQLGSFSLQGSIAGLHGAFPMEFIRAPYVISMHQDVEVIAKDAEEHVVGVTYCNQIGLAFHPELTADTRLHEMFLQMI